MPPVAYARSRNRLVCSKYDGCDIDLAVTRRRAAVSAAVPPGEQAGFELAVPFAQVSPRTRVASFKAPLSITRPLGNDAGQADMI